MSSDPGSGTSSGGGWGGFLSAISDIVAPLPPDQAPSGSTRTTSRRKSTINRLFSDVLEFVAPLPPELQTAKEKYARASEYPYRWLSVLREGSPLLVSDLFTSLDIESGTIENFAKRTPVLGYGSNASPDQLRRKYDTSFCSNDTTSKKHVIIPIMMGTLEDFDSVYAASITGYGAIPATLAHSPGSQLRVAITYVSDEQLARMHETEGSYKYVRLENISLTLDKHLWRPNATPDEADFPPELFHLKEVYSYVSKHGALCDPRVQNQPGDSSRNLLALSACIAKNRNFAELSEEDMLELVHNYSEEVDFEDADLETFTLAHIEDANLRKKRAQRLQQSSNSPWSAEQFSYPSVTFLETGVDLEEASPSAPHELTAPSAHSASVGENASTPKQSVVGTQSAFNEPKSQPLPPPPPPPLLGAPPPPYPAYGEEVVAAAMLNPPPPPAYPTKFKEDPISREMPTPMGQTSAPSPPPYPPQNTSSLSSSPPPPPYSFQQQSPAQPEEVPTRSPPAIEEDIGPSADNSQPFNSEQLERQEIFVNGMSES